MSASKKDHLHILVPRLADSSNRNAQNQNARSLLSRFSAERVTWHIFSYDEPDQALTSRSNICCEPLRRGRLWHLHAIAKYLKNYDAIFYPGNESFDALALILRRVLGRSIPVISTLEGLPGDEIREAKLSAAAKHPVHCFRPRSGTRFTRSFDRVRAYSDLSIAITPFMAAMGAEIYPVEQTHLPIGIDDSIFHATGRNYPSFPRIVGAGTLYEAKRPDVFIDLARRFPDVQFSWFGDGPMRKNLLMRTRELENLDFPGEISAEELAVKLREATAFVLPSLSEGLPKVTQEAVACGLPVVVFGTYETPSVVDGVNGIVVWDCEALIAAVEKLVKSPKLVWLMGAEGSIMAESWSWDKLAPRWEQAILKYLDRRIGTERNLIGNC